MDTAHPPTAARLSPPPGPLSGTWPRTGGLREGDQPQVPWFLSGGTAARTRGRRFLTVWVTTRAAGAGINWTDQKLPFSVSAFHLALWQAPTSESKRTPSAPPGTAPSHSY